MRIAAPVGPPRPAVRGPVRGPVPWLVGLAAGLVALGPALRPGHLLRLDMVSVPDPPLVGALLGIEPALPRAVPSDLVAAVLAHVAPSGAAVKLLLLAAFALAVVGAARLVPTGHAMAATAGGLFYAWNPWTTERLSMGHWAILLGYAGLPWVAAAARRVACRGPRGVPALGVALLLPAVGGVTTCVLAGVLVIAVLAAARAHPEQWLTGLAAVAVGSLPWLLPALLHRVATRPDPAGVDAFALRPDGPFGPVGTAVQLAGVWNRLVVPGNRSVLIVQVAMLGLVAFAGWGLWRARRRIQGHAALLGAGLAGLVLAVLPTVAPGAAAMRTVIRLLPAAAAMRDSHRWLALLALPLAVGFGAAVDALASRAAAPAGRTPVDAPASQAAAPASRTPVDAPASQTTAPAGRTPVDALASRAAAPAGRTPVDALASRAAALAGRAAVAAVALLAPVAVNPGLAWGLAGRLQPVHYPPDWYAARAAVAADTEPGAVLALPWSPFRDYPWNASDVPVLDPAPRMFDRTVLWNDTVQVGGTTIAGESADAAGMGALLAGDGPLDTALRAWGIRYVLVETGQIPAVDAGRLGGTPVVTGPDLVLYRLDGPVAPLPAAVRGPALVVAADLVALLAVLACTTGLLPGKLRVRGDPSGQR